MRSSRVVVCASGIFVVIAAHVESVSVALRCSQRSFARSLALRLASTKVCLCAALCGRRRIEVSERGRRMGHNLSPPPKLGGDSSWAVTMTPRHPPNFVPKKII
jgi:hypothetical protein